MLTRSSHLRWSAAFIALAIPATPAIGQSAPVNSITLTVGTANQTGYRNGSIPRDFLGISLEMNTIEASYPANQNNRWLTGAATPLFNALSRIGVRSIRIGGNSAERVSVPDPKTDDAHGVMDFAGKLGAGLLWTLPVKDKLGVAYNDKTTPPPNLSQYSNFAADLSAYAATTNFNNLTYLIGNEPDHTFDASAGCSANTNPANNALADYATYAKRVQAYLSSFSSLGIGTLISGPASSSNKPGGFSESFATGPGVASQTDTIPIDKAKVRFATGHIYPLGGTSVDNIPGDPSYSVANQIDLYLQNRDALYKTFYSGTSSNGSASTVYAGWPSKAVGNGLTARVDETNGQWADCNYPQPLQHSYAAALWAVDYLSYLAYKTNVGGVNMHSAGTGSSSQNVSGYNVFAPMDNNSNTAIHVGPVGYGMFAFAYGSGGTPLAAALTNTGGLSASTLSHVSAYALQENGSSGTGATVHLLNKTLDTDLTASISISGYAHAQVMYLMQTDSDPQATDGITLGGFAFDLDGKWNAMGGNPWKPSIAPTNGVFTVSVPKAQVALIHFYN